jgi:tetratricopeptide (TPR) repeat protein
VALKDPTAWADDISFYMTEEDLAQTAAAREPLLLHGRSKAAAAAWMGLVGALGGAFGAVTVSPAIRHPIAFAAYVVVTALLLRGLYPLTVRVLGRAIAWIAMFAFFWAAWLGLCVLVAARIDSTWIGYGVSIGGGAFIGMMYGAFPPDSTRNQDAWMLAFLVAPVSAFLATYVLRHTGGLDTLGGAAGAGALCGALFTGSMGVLLMRLWDEAQGLAEMGQLYLHNDTFAPKAVAYLDRAIALSPDNARYYNLRAVALALLNEPERASADWDKASALAPQDPEPHVNRGMDRLRRGAVPEAIRAFQYALARNPEHGRAHCYLGAAWERQGDVTRAFEHYDRAVAAGRDDARIYCDRSAAHVRRGDYAKALEDADRAVHLEDHLGIAYAARGQALAMLGRTDEALDSFGEAIDLGLEPSVHQEVLRRVESLRSHAEDQEHL